MLESRYHKYYRPQESELLEEYLKAVPELIILEARPPQAEDVESLKQKNSTLEERLSELEAQRKKDERLAKMIL